MPRFDIQIRSEAGKIRYPLARLKKSAEKILRILKLKKGSLSVLLLNDAQIRRVNKKHLKHDYATDVISFDETGDIVISLQTAKRMAKEVETSFDYEVHLYLCHGILHLMGYDDHAPKNRAKMWRKQEEILNLVIARSPKGATKQSRIKSEIASPLWGSQ